MNEIIDNQLSFLDKSPAGKKLASPILKYPGGKFRLSNWIISRFPRHKSYLEPFFGGGSVYFHKVPSERETINDIDGNVVNFFKTVRDYPTELARAVEFTPWSRDEYCDFRVIATDSELEVYGCGDTFFTSDEFNYCPSCGVKIKRD